MSFVRNLPREALDVDRLLVRERNKMGGCGIRELRLGPERASSGEERQSLVWLGKCHCKDVRNISEHFGLFSYIYDVTAGHVIRRYVFPLSCYESSIESCYESCIESCYESSIESCYESSIESCYESE